MSEAELSARLAERFRRRPEDRLVYLRADRELDYGRVQSAMAASAAAGARVVGLVTEQLPPARRSEALARAK